MIELTREELKANPEGLGLLLEVVKKNHVIASHTKKTLLEHKNIKNFCEKARHFMIIQPNPREQLYIHYDIASWFIEPADVAVTIESITVYEDFKEYESARITQLHAAKDADGANLN